MSGHFIHIDLLCPSAKLVLFCFKQAWLVKHMTPLECNQDNLDKMTRIHSSNTAVMYVAFTFTRTVVRLCHLPGRVT